MFCLSEHHIQCADKQIWNITHIKAPIVTIQTLGTKTAAKQCVKARPRLNAPCSLCRKLRRDERSLLFFQVILPPGCLRLVKWNRSVRAELESTDDNSVWLICASVWAIQHPQPHNQGISWILTHITITSYDSQLLLLSCAHSFLKSLFELSYTLS